MGAGNFSAGAGPAGDDPIVTGTSPVRRTPSAIRYEGRTQDWALDSTGQYRSVHPVDQGFALGLSVNQGDIKSSPTTGNTLRQIKYLGEQNLGADIENRVRAANPIARYLADGSAVIRRIDHEVTEFGGLKVAVYYVNLKLDPNRINRADYES